MRLYYHPVSSNSRRAVLVARHLGLDVAFVTVDLANGEHKTPDFLSLNPNGKVPALVDGAFVLWESYAIIQYLADTAPGQEIYPKDIAARADVNRWLFWSAYHFAPTAGLLIKERVSKKLTPRLGPPDPQEIARGEALLPPLAAMLDSHLADRQWIAQDRLTLADFAIAATLMHTAAAQLPVTDCAHLQAWFARVQALDAWVMSTPATP
ncbi:MAG: glutathione S-transferase family protein [Rhodospirillaceae bacterium]|nr:glutathione S-transferase family protein [Rhodospirillaceae bacterium]